MTEFELHYLIVERRTELVSILQWWVALSIGLVTATHLIKHSLNLLVAILFTVPYIVFSMIMLSMLASLAGQLGAAFDDLLTYSEANKLASLQTKELLGVWSNGTIRGAYGFIRLLAVGFALAIGLYPLWRWWEVRGDHEENT